MASPPDAVLHELDGLRALARALVGEVHADDLLQETAIAAIEHPPETDRPVRPWLAAVLRNRFRMDRRAASRRHARELAVPERDPSEPADRAIDRARTLERLSSALVALDEPFRTAVIRRYLDGESAATIARALAVPAGTVRWRVKTGLDRLRAALDETSPRWRRALIPLVPFAKGAVIVKLKASIVAVIILLLVVGAGVWLATRTSSMREPQHASRAAATKPIIVAPLAKDAPLPAPVREPLPGQGRAHVADAAAAGGIAAGRVINWSSGDGVANADVTFTGESGALTVHTRADGSFELAPPAPGEFTLTAIGAAGFLPYAPEFFHSPVHFALAKDHAVRGITVFLFPALDYHGRVVDADGAPVAGARVKLLGTPAGEQVIDRLATEWISAADGTFTFHGADDAVFEAVHGNRRGWARLDGNVAITKQLVIKLADAPAHDASITGRAVDDDGHPIADVLVTALPVELPNAPVPRATIATVTNPDGTFTLDHLDRDAYEVAGEIEGRAAARMRVTGGTAGVTLTIHLGVEVAGAVVTADGAPIPAFTLVVFRREGAARGFELGRSVVDPRGRFTVHVMPGDVELIAAASGWAPSAPSHVTANAPITDLRLVVSAGATLRGAVTDAADHSPISYARVMREARGGGASAQPANAGTVTRGDGTFELTGIPAGPLAITIGADGYHPKIEAGLAAHDGEDVGPIAINLTKLAPGEEPSLELVGIGVKLTADGDALRVEMVIPGGGAAAAGIGVGDHIVSVDGASASEIGVDGAVARIRGNAGTTVALALRRGDAVITLSVERRKLKA